MLGWVDTAPSAASAELRATFASQPGVTLVESTRVDALDQMNLGKIDAVIVVPDGYAESLAASTATGGGQPAQIGVLTDTSRPQLAGAVYSVVGNALGIVNLGGKPPLVVAASESIQTESLNAISYYVPSILGLSVMQLGIFAAVALVADREKGILKRLAATPLRRWQLVGSNVLMRLLIALVQTIIIVAVGTLVFGVQIVGSMALALAFVVLGAVTFLALGYVIASFASTEDAANSMTSIVQFPMMFLSGVFFQIDQMPPFLQAIARLIPLTYLADALRQVMVGGAPIAPLTTCALVLVGWLVVCFAISSRKFRWQ